MYTNVSPSDKVKGNLVSIPEPGDGTALIIIILVVIMSR
jgi:hypothetical protein